MTIGNKYLGCRNPQEQVRNIYCKLFFKSRGNGFEAFKLMREARQDIFGETTGVLMEEREKWHDIRQVLLVCHEISDMIYDFSSLICFCFL